MVLYLIGSLRNPRVPEIAKGLRGLGHEIFDDWYAAGAQADDAWRDYSRGKGKEFKAALSDHPARHVFNHDHYHLNRSHGGILVLPAGKSCHLELGYIVGQGKPGFMLTDGDPERYDVMAQFATVCRTEEELTQSIRDYAWPPIPGLPRVTHTEFMWLLGLLEGEGTFVSDSMPSRPRPRIALQLTDEDVLKRAAALLGSHVWGPYRKPAPRKPVWACAVTGAKAAEWMRILRPYLGTRRREAVDKVLSVWNPYAYRKHTK